MRGQSGSPCFSGCVCWDIALQAIAAEEPEEDLGLCWSGVHMSEPSREGSVQGRNYSKHLGGG